MQMIKILTESCTAIFRSIVRQTMHTDAFDERWRYIKMEVKSSFLFQLLRHAVQIHAEMGAAAPLPAMVHTSAHVH